MFADSLATKPLPVISASEHIAACLAIDAKANPLQHTVEWEWDDEHMSADVANVPMGEPDPPMDASLQQLRVFRTAAADDLIIATRPAASIEPNRSGQWLDS